MIYSILSTSGMNICVGLFKMRKLLKDFYTFSGLFSNVNCNLSSFPGIKRRMSSRSHTTFKKESLYVHSSQNAGIFGTGSHQMNVEIQTVSTRVFGEHCKPL